MEGLEPRRLLYATTGDLWTYPQRITFSFAPDGTSVGGTPSNLFATLNARFPTATWENAFLRAAAAWEQVANVNLVLVPDNGQPIGSMTNQQGGANAGDIRIGAFAQSAGTLAFTFLPPPDNGGSDAGDMFFNSNVAWQINGDYDLQTVAIHEIGHALGMDHSAIASADMYAQYTGQKQSLTSDDVAGIQSIDEARQPDAFNVGGANNSTSTAAADITPRINASAQIAIPSLDILGPASPEWFKMTVPTSSTGTMVVSMQSTNLSELSPRVQVYNSALQSLSYATAPNAFGATVQVTISGVTPGQVYYIKDAAASGGTTGAGNYGLLVNFGSSTQSPIAPPFTTVPDQVDLGGGTLNEILGLGDAGDQGASLGGLGSGSGSGSNSPGAGGDELSPVANTATPDGQSDKQVAVVGGLIGVADTLSVSQGFHPNPRHPEVRITHPSATPRVVLHGFASIRHQAPHRTHAEPSTG